MITRHHGTSERGVSPVVAVILLVAVTVTLSAVIGGFALELGQSATGNGASQQEVGVSTSESNGQYTATIVTGSADKVKLLVNGTKMDTVTDASAGDALTANVSPGSDVTIITVTNKQSSVTTSETITSTTSGGTTAVAPTDGLVTYWTLDDGDVTSTKAIDTANGYNATFSSSPTSVTGIHNGGLSFDGTDDNATYGSQFSFTGPFTFAFWMKPDSISKQVTPMHDNDGSHPSKFYIHVNKSGNNYITIDMSDGTSWHSVTSTTSIQPGKYYHVSTDWNGSYLKLYVNGTLEDSTAISGQQTGSDGAAFGSGNGNGYFNGVMDDVRVYNQSLNQTEVNNLYNATK